MIIGIQPLCAQDIDSLVTKYDKATSDSVRFETILGFYAKFSESSPALFLKASEAFLDHAKKNKDKVAESFAYSMIYCHFVSSIAS